MHVARRSAAPLAILLATITACAPGASSSTAVVGQLVGIALAGPTCPVVTDPPQSGCDERPVAGARLVIVDDAGAEVTTTTTGEDGRFGLDLPPGPYELRPQPVDGLMSTAPVVRVTVTSGAPAEVTISYDTGIR